MADSESSGPSEGMVQASACMSKMAIHCVCIPTSSRSAPSLHRQDSCEEDLGCLAPLAYRRKYLSVDSRVQEDNIIAVLERPDRVHKILLSRISIPLERLVTVMQEQFLGMDTLSLKIEGGGGTVPALPNTSAS
jgi:hypothetical protein